MKSTTNVFLGGLKTDLHPLSTELKVLTDALNATMITYNGNEMMLQNDMGNTLIQDSTTGHIMGLSEGFVPVGLKEHGGIMYIASVNKEGKGEIGTIPSPILTLSLKNVELEDKDITLVQNSGPIQNIVPITDFKVYPGEKFLPLLNINTTLNIGEFIVLTPDGPIDLYEGKQLVSEISEETAHNGLYQLKLYSIYDNNQVELPQVYLRSINPIVKGGSKLENNYWFITSDNYDNIDVEKTYLDNLFQTYPGNIPPGKLGIKAELETIDYFGLIKITQMVGSRQHDTLAPLVVENDESHTYELWFPGFEYGTLSIRLIKTILVQVSELYSGEPVFEKVFNDGSNDLATVLKEPNKYQIQSVLSAPTTYKIIEPQTDLITDAENYFTPLFKVEGIINLDTWYQLTVKYYDQFGGYINTYQFSFNPLHIRKYSESYYNVGWTPSVDAILQLWPLEGDPTYTPVITINPESDSNYKLTLMLASSQFEETERGDWKTTYDTNLTFSGYDNTSVTYNINIQPSDKYRYLWPDNVQMSAVFNGPEIGVALHYTVETNPNQYAEELVYGNFSGLDISVSVMDVRSNKEKFKIPFTFSSNNELYYSYRSSKSVEFLFPITGLDLSYTMEWQPVNNIQLPLTLTIDHINQPDTISAVLTEGAEATVTIKVQNQEVTPKDQSYTFPDPIYSLIPSFNIFGDTDEEMNLPLGLTRNGQLTKAWSFENNLYDLHTLIHKNNTSFNDVSTFSQDTSYFPTELKNAKTVIIDKGVYLINIDHMIQEGTPSCYFEVDGQKYDLIQCNASDGRSWIAPTLIYLPSRCLFLIGWENIKRLLNIGVYRVLEDVLMIDGSSFGDTKSVEVKYYQSTEFVEDTEMILPLEATYYENTECLNQTFTYYPGLSDCSHCNKHILIRNMTGGDNNSFNISEYLSFIYLYNESNPLEAVIPLIEGLKGNTLTYRIENNGDN